MFVKNFSSSSAKPPVLIHQEETVRLTTLLCWASILNENSFSLLCFSWDVNVHQELVRYLKAEK